ncbi:MAG: hypothetical protein LC670_07740, partial [Flavobacteriales bacterium]|nr:hypothetical protein [Flavobacteriales bacterium]
NGDFGGTAFLDNCDECVGGNTGEVACAADCNGDFGGTAFIDNCGTCVSGDTGFEACLEDCNGVFGGTGETDDCGECIEDGEGSPFWNLSCADCEGIPNGDASPGTPCEVDGESGEWAESCECEVQAVPACSNFRTFLANNNDLGGTDIYEVILDDLTYTATLNFLIDIDIPVSIAFNESDQLLYLVHVSEAVYRTLNVNAAEPSLSAPVHTGYNRSGLTGAAFDNSGMLHVASESSGRIYSFDPSTGIALGFSNAPVSGGDIAFGPENDLYMVSTAPRRAFEIIGGAGNEVLGFVPPASVGLALMSDQNFLLSVDGRKKLIVGDADAQDTGIRYALKLDGNPFTLSDGDLASGCAPIRVYICRYTGSLKTTVEKMIIAR